VSAAGAERRKVVAIFFLAVASGLALATLGLRELQATSDSYERLLREHVSTALRVERLNMLSEKLGRLSRSYLLTPDPGFVDGIARTRDEFEGELAALREGLASEGASELLGRVKSAEARHEAAVDEALRMRRQGGVTRALVAALETDVGAARRDFDQALAALGAFEDRLLARRIGEAMGRARNGTRLLLAAIAAALVLVGALSWLLARTLAGLQRSRAELAASMARLEAANRDLDAFAGRIAHDLRNALAPAAVAAAALRRTLDARQIERSATRVEAAVRRADGLIDGLLAFARAGQPARQAAVAPLRQITGEVLDTFAHTRALVDASVTLDVDDLGVRCPPSLLYTVLANLVSNALKFVEGRPRREVRI
jgi:CHASE3 domain sensor protein